MNDGRVPDPSLEFITCSAALAHHGLLGAVDYVTLVDVDRNKLVDLSTIPAHHLVSLISSATRGVRIDHVTGCDLVSLIDSLKCKKLTIILLRTLGMEETQALLRAMESRVEVVDLSLVEISIEALTKYSAVDRDLAWRLSVIPWTNFSKNLKLGPVEQTGCCNRPLKNL